MNGEQALEIQKKKHGLCPQDCMVQRQACKQPSYNTRRYLLCED